MKVLVEVYIEQFTREQLNEFVRENKETRYDKWNDTVKELVRKYGRSIVQKIREWLDKRTPAEAVPAEGDLGR